MSRRSQVVRSSTTARASAVVTPPISVGGNPAFGSIRGSFILDPGDPWLRLSADRWWQTPRLDDFVVVEEELGGHVFRVRAACDLAVLFSCTVELPADDDEPGYFRAEIATQTHDNLTYGVIDHYAGSRGFTEGPFKRSAYVSDDSVYIAGISIADSFRFDFETNSELDPYIDLFPSFRNALENTVLYGDWKMTVILLDESTERAIGGIG